MKMTNMEIYNAARRIVDAFEDSKQYLPVKVNFFIQKNKAKLSSLAEDIEKSRVEIIKNYGKIDEETGQYTVAPEDIEAANKELEDLFALEQDVQIYKVSIDDFKDDLSLTTGQMEALMFMID